MANDIKDAGQYFDLDQCEKAYGLGGKETTWVDYSNGNGSWDEDKYYSDFEAWWQSLPNDEQVRIYKGVFGIS